MDLSSIKENLNNMVSMNTVSNNSNANGLKYELPPKQQPVTNNTIDISKFEDGLKKLGLYDFVRHLKYPVV